MGIVPGALALFILLGAGPLTLPLFLIGAAVAGNYFIATVSAQLFPETLWSDPEFSDAVPQRLFPQQLVSYALCGLLVVSFALALYMT